MNRLFFLALILPALMLVMWGCENDTANKVAAPGGGGGIVTDKTCIGCHESEELLKAALPAESGSAVPVPNKGDG